MSGIHLSDAIEPASPDQGVFVAHSALYFGRGWRYIWVIRTGNKHLTLLRMRADDMVQKSDSGGEAASDQG